MKQALLLREKQLHRKSNFTGQKRTKKSKGCKMPRKVEYYECDCRKGRLEELARTQEAGGYEYEEGQYGRYVPQEQTIFYACNKCKRIYKENRTDCPSLEDDVRRVNGKSAIKVYNQIVPYIGKLSRKEIKKKTPGIQGILDEKKV